MKPGVESLSLQGRARAQGPGPGTGTNILWRAQQSDFIIFIKGVSNLSRDETRRRERATQVWRVWHWHGGVWHMGLGATDVFACVPCRASWEWETTGRTTCQCLKRLSRCGGCGGGGVFVGDQQP